MSTFKELASRMKAPGEQTGAGNGKGHSFSELAATMTPPKEQPVVQALEAKKQQSIGTETAGAGSLGLLLAASERAENVRGGKNPVFKQDVPQGFEDIAAQQRQGERNLYRTRLDLELAKVREDAALKAYELSGMGMESRDNYGIWQRAKHAQERAERGLRQAQREAQAAEAQREAAAEHLRLAVLDPELAKKELAELRAQSVQAADLDALQKASSVPGGLVGHLAATQGENRAFQQKINALEADIAGAERIRTGWEYQENTLAPDFAQNSRYQPGVVDDPDYNYINRDPAAVQAKRDAMFAGNGIVLDIPNQFVEQMNEEEIALFNYLYHTKGKDAAYEYIRFLEPDLNARQRGAETAEWQAEAEKHPVGMSALTIAMAPTKVTSALGHVVEYAFGGGKIDQNAGYNRYSYLPGAVRAKVSELAEDKWGKKGSFLYNTGMSMGDFLMTALAGGGFSGVSAGEKLALGIMGSGAAADATIAAKDRGLSDDQALLLGTAAGMAEVITEKVSLEKLLDMTSLDKNAMGYLLKNMLAEGSEEVGSDLINWYADVLVSLDKSEWQQSIDAYRAGGETDRQAFIHAVTDQAQAMGLDFLGGALSGGVMAGGMAALNRGTGYRQNGPGLDGMQAKEDAGKESTGNTMLTENDLEEYLKVGERGHVRNQKDRLVKSGQSPILTTLEQVKSFIRSAFKGDTTDTVKAYGRVGSRFAEDVAAATDGTVDISGYYLELDSNRLSHMSDHVGVDKDARSIPLTEEQIENLTEYIDTYDDIVEVKQYKDGGVRVMLGKRINGHSIIVEAVSKGRHALHPVTAYQISTEKYNRDYKTRAAGRSSTSHVHGSTQVDISRPAATLADNSIPQTTQKSKRVLSDEERGVFGPQGQLAVDAAVENSMLNGKSKVEAYAAFAQAYQQGLTGEEMTAVDGLTRDGVETAYRAGREDAEASLAREKRAARFASVAGDEAGLVLDDYVDETMESGEYDVLNETVKRLGVRVRFVDELKHGANADIHGSEILIQKDNPNPVRFLLGHEFAHRLQALAPEAYRQFRDLAMGQLGSEMTLERRESYGEQGVDVDYEGAMDELTADYAGLLMEHGKVLEDFIAEAQRRDNRTLLEKVRDLFRELAAKLTGKQREQAMTAEQALSKALMEAEKQAKKNAKKNAGKNKTAATEGGGIRYSIEKLPDGKQYVRADRQVIFGNDPVSWGRQVEDYINGKIRRGQDVQLLTEEGEILTLTSDTAGKARHAYKPDGTRMTDDEYLTKVNAEAHIDELVQVSTKYRTKADEGGRHGAFASGGWQYRTAYFMDYDGKYYRVKISVAQGPNGNIVYNIGDIQERSFPNNAGFTAHGSSAKGGALAVGKASTNSIPDSGAESKEKFSLTDSAATEGDGVRYSLGDTKITDAEIAAVQGIGRKSVNDFTGAEIKATEKFARRYWQEMGEKSPFFRSWFGDWRVNDQTPVQVVDAAKGKPYKAGKAVNTDTSRTISWGDTLRTETRGHRGPVNMLQNIEEIVQKAVLLDTFASEPTSKSKMQGTAFMHSFYSIVNNGGTLELYKLYAEEAIGKNGEPFTRGYELKSIERVVAPFGVRPQNAALSGGTTTNHTVADLFAAVKQSDKNFRPKPVSKVIDKDGKPLVVYHGTPQGGFTVFDRKKIGTNTDDGIYGPGFYFSSYKNNSEQYAAGPDGELYELYLNIKNPLKLADYSKKELSELLGMEERDIVESRGIPRPTYSMARTFKSRVLDAGFDGIIVDYGTSNEIIVFAPEQIKSAEDNIGTFDGSNPDIRFSLTGAREFADAVLEVQSNREGKSDAQVRREIVRLTEEFREKLIQEEAQGLTDKTAVRRAGRQLIKEFGADMKPGEIAEDLQALYDYMAGGETGDGNIAYGQAREQAVEVARKLVDSATVVDDTLYREFSDLRGYLRDTKIVVPEEVVKEIGDFGDYRKATMGKLRLGTKGHANLDMVYSELCEMYPAWFDGEAYAAADQLDQIVSAAEAIYSRPEYNPFDGGDIEQVVQAAASEIMEKFYDLPQAKNEQSKRMPERERAALRREVSEQLNRQREYNDRQMKKVRQKHRETVTQLETKNLRRRIARHANQMGRALLRPTDKKHIPENLRGAAATLVEAINLESAYVWSYDEETGKARMVLEKNDPEGVKTKRTEAFLELREQYAVILQGIKDGDGDFMGVIDPQLAEYIDEAIRLRDKRLGEMDRAELDTIWKALRAVEHSIETADRVLSEAKFERVEEWANALAGDTGGRKNKRAFSEKHPSLDLETPYTFFSHMGESGTAIYKMLRKAQDKQQMMVEEIARAVSEIVTPEQVQALQEEVHKFTTERGQMLTLTTAQVMEIYELTKRKQAHDHLLEGGIVQPEIPKTGKQEKIRRGTEPVKLSMEDLKKLSGLLTVEQTELADKMQKLCVTTLARWGNEASVRAYGYKKFTDPNYWPIKSAREGLYQTVEKGGDQPRQIKNIGMGKATTPHANTPMDISGIFATFARHAADMSDYAAWLCPMEDCTRLYNYKFRDEEGATTGQSIKSLLEQKAGEQAQTYWSNLMEDIQNGIVVKSDSMIWNGMAKFAGSFKAAAVGGNVRVVIQQPTAFFRAAAVLDPKDLAAGMKGGVSKVTGEDGKALSGWEKAMKYAPIAVRKDRGGFDISSPRKMTEILYDERSRLRKFEDGLYTGAAAKADAITWGGLWNACEHAVRREQQNLETGSDAFFQAVSEKFSDVIDQTQVVDGVLQRSNIMRSSNAVVQQATSFMGEPIMSLNLMMRAWDAWRYEQNPARRGKALKIMGRAATALVVTNLVNAAAQSLVDAMRADDPDKDYWERFLAAFTGLDGKEKNTWKKIWNVAFVGNMGSNNNVLTMVPFMKDAVSVIQGYDVSRTEMEVISDFFLAAKGVIQNIGGDGQRTRAYVVNALIRSAARLFGKPVQNLERDIWGVLRTFAVGTDNIPMQYEMEKAVYNLSYAGNRQRFMDVMFRALEQEDYEAYDHIRRDLMETGVMDGKTIDSGMRSRLDARRRANPGYALPDRAAELIGWRAGNRTGGVNEARFDEGGLDAAQYKAFSEERAELYRGYTARLDSNRYFDELDDETREKIYSMAEKLAREKSLENHAAGQYETETSWVLWASGGADYGVDETEAILFKAAYDMASGQDENGKTVAGLKKQRTLETAEQWMPGLTDRELEYLKSQYWK